MELYYVFSIVDRSESKKLISILEGLQLSVIISNLGRGTAKSEHLSLYDLEPSEKAIVVTVANASSAKQLIRQAKRKLFIDIPGNGIMMTVPIKSVGGGRTLAYISDGQSLGGALPDMEFEHELIVVILNEGHSDTVMDAARAAGAGGGTVFHAKGTGRAKSEKFFGVSLAEEKDMIYILAPTGKKTAIMKAITSSCGAGTQAGAICFSLPVSEVAGLRRLDEE